MHLRLRVLLGLLLGAALVAATAGCVRTAGTDVSAATPDARLQLLLDRWRQRAAAPAVTVAVDGPGRPRLVAASGTPGRGGGAPVRADARFRVASVTKMYLATVVLQLVDEGRIRLDDRLAEHVPSFRGGDGVTIRQLLNHTSGIPDYDRSQRYFRRLLADREHRWSTDEVLGIIAGLRPEFSPGTDYSYSNTGYILLGRVIDAVTGSTWAVEIRRRILDPLHLRHTYVAGFEPARGSVLPGYIDIDEDGEQDNVETGRPWPALETSEGAAGAIVSTASDLASFGDALFHGRLLPAAMLRQMTTEGPHHPRNSGYGLGLEILRPDYRTTIWGHGGFTLGFRAALRYVPRHDRVIVVLVNDVRADPQDLAELVLRTEIATRAGRGDHPGRRLASHRPAGA
jgi:D-alanyl-D-alanine carboxypeptidase